MPNHVFVSYNSKDEELVKEISGGLKDLDLTVFLDIWDLHPGHSWISELENAIRGAACSIVFIGKHGLGPWQKDELKLLLSRSTRNSAPIIPVFLPDAKRPKLPAFLALSQQIDCRSDSRRKDPRLIVSGLLEALAKAITRRGLLRSVPQIGEEFTLSLKGGTAANRIITLYTFPNPNPNQLLHLTWATMGKGISNIHNQIKSYGYHPNVDACIGVNDAGLVMSTFLNSSALSRVKLGYVRCKGAVDDAILVSDSFFPQLERNPKLLITDFEVKAANVLKFIVKALRDRYSNPKIYFAVFGAMTGKPSLRISRFDELTSAKNLSDLKLEENVFIAGTMHHPGIEPPLELR